MLTTIEAGRAGGATSAEELAVLESIQQHLDTDNEPNLLSARSRFGLRQRCPAFMKAVRIL